MRIVQSKFVALPRSTGEEASADGSPLLVSPPAEGWRFD